ncbi:MAG: phosphatase PAP2 family protein [Rhodanobacteraceae bacterium]
MALRSCVHPRYVAVLLLVVVCAFAPLRVAIAGGPFLIDHEVPLDNSGIWQRRNQLVLEYGTIATVVGGSLLLGNQSKLGDTFWRSLDALAVGSAVSQVAKWTFSRERPNATTDPGKFFQFQDFGSNKAESFPSGEVTAIAAAVTPFIYAYHEEHPAVYALELLPLYDAVGRVKVHGHWQSDVLAGWALGTAAGIWAGRRKSPLILSWLPGGFEIGFIHRF